MNKYERLIMKLKEQDPLANHPEDRENFATRQFVLDFGGDFVVYQLLLDFGGKGHLTNIDMIDRRFVYFVGSLSTSIKKEITRRYSEDEDFKPIKNGECAMDGDTTNVAPYLRYDISKKMKSKSFTYPTVNTEDDHINCIFMTHGKAMLLRQIKGEYILYLFDKNRVLAIICSRPDKFVEYAIDIHLGFYNFVYSVRDKINHFENRKSKNKINEAYSEWALCHIYTIAINDSGRCEYIACSEPYAHISMYNTASDKVSECQNCFSMMMQVLEPVIKGSTFSDFMYHLGLNKSTSKKYRNLKECDVLDVFPETRSRYKTITGYFTFTTHDTISLIQFRGYRTDVFTIVCKDKAKAKRELYSFFNYRNWRIDEVHDN